MCMFFLLLHWSKIGLLFFCSGMDVMVFCLLGALKPSLDLHTFLAETGSYTCEFCGKQYKYFNPYQEHVALHTPLGRWSNPPPMTKWPLLNGWCQFMISLIGWCESLFLSIIGWCECSICLIWLVRMDLFLLTGHSFDMQSPRSQQKKNVNKYTSARSDRGPSGKI